MTRVVIRSLVAAIPTLLLLILLVSVLVRLIPGNAIDFIMRDSGADAEARARLTENLGLNKSVIEQYVVYLGDTANGSLGHSLYDGRPVIDYIALRAAPTVQLATLAFSVSTFVGIAVGLTSAMRRGSRLDYALRLFVSTSLGIPNFVLATALILLPAYYFQWTPPLRYVRFTVDPVENMIFLLVPSFTLGLGLAASVARITRTATLEVMYEDYIRTARAKGLNESTVILRHVLRNSLLPVLTLLGLQAGFLMSGVVVIEQVFSIPGLGTLMITKIAERDYPVIQGITLVSGVIVIFVNLLVDLSYGLLNPRLRVG